MEAPAELSLVNELNIIYSDKVGVRLGYSHFHCFGY